MCILSILFLLHSGPNCNCLPLSGKCKCTNQAKSLQTAGTQSFPLSPVSPLTSQTQLTEKLPVHTKSVLSALWRHSQRKLSTSTATPQHHRLVNSAFFFKGKKGTAEEVPKTAHNVWEKEAAHINLKPSQPGFTPRWGTPRGDGSLGPNEELGSISWTDLAWSPSNCHTESVRCVYGINGGIHNIFPFEQWRHIWDTDGPVGINSSWEEIINVLSYLSS